jgi:hypothetical protein
VTTVSARYIQDVGAWTKQSGMPCEPRTRSIQSLR